MNAQLTTKARDGARRALLAHLDTATPEGGLSETGFAQLGELVRELAALTPYPRPAEAPQVLAGRWQNLFAHFGARHSAGKPRVHESTLKVHSFNKLPAAPISVSGISQNVSADGSVYNNVVSIVTPQGGLAGEIVTHGRWVVDDVNPQRLNIEFWKMEVVPGPGIAASDFRAALGLAHDQTLSADLKVGKLYSDVIYLDERYRINIGSQGGLYVLSRS